MKGIYHSISIKTTMATYQLRKRGAVNYKESNTVNLPRAMRVRKREKLYDLEVIEEDASVGRVKVHYIGYGTDEDEWRDEADIVMINQPQSGILRPFNIHNELLYQIKSALNSSSRCEPDVRLEVPFDLLSYRGGLQQAGSFIKKSRGHDVYTIRTYSALNPFLGEQWHIRVLNERCDFCYVILTTISYHIHQRKDIIDPLDTFRSIEGGYILVFHFVRGDGLKHHWEDITSME